MKREWLIPTLTHSLPQERSADFDKNAMIAREAFFYIYRSDMSENLVQTVLIGSGMCSGSECGK